MVKYEISDNQTPRYLTDEISFTTQIRSREIVELKMTLNFNVRGHLSQSPAPNYVLIRIQILSQFPVQTTKKGNSCQIGT